MRIAKLIVVVVLLGPERSIDAVAVASKVPDNSLGLGFLSIS